MAELNEQDIKDTISKTKKMGSDVNENIQILAENEIETIIEEKEIIFMGGVSRYCLLTLIFKKIL